VFIRGFTFVFGFIRRRAGPRNKKGGEGIAALRVRPGGLRAGDYTPTW